MDLLWPGTLKGQTGVTSGRIKRTPSREDPCGMKFWNQWPAGEAEWGRRSLMGKVKVTFDGWAGGFSGGRELWEEALAPGPILD